VLQKYLLNNNQLSMEWYQIVGYTGSALVAVSLMMKNILHLRRVNLVGASIFATYGFLVGAYPVFILNSFISIIDIYYLYTLNKKKELFSLMPVLDNKHRFLNKFLVFHQKDILKYFPDFKNDDLNGANCFFILRNLMPVGLFIYREISETQIKIIIDYSIPDYRDYKNAKFIYNAESDFLKERGYNELITESSVKIHQKYLLNIGFERDQQNAELFRKNI
jgi:hypothetical protein